MSQPTYFIPSVFDPTGRDAPTGSLDAQWFDDRSNTSQVQAQTSLGSLPTGELVFPKAPWLTLTAYPLGRLSALERLVVLESS